MRAYAVAVIRETRFGPEIREYLQRIDGEIALPPGFVPTRLRVQLTPRQGKPLQATFEWRQIADA